MIDFLLKYYKIIALALVIPTIVAILFILRGIPVDNSLSIWFVEDDPVYENYLQFRENYGSDEIITILIKTETGIYDRQIIEQMIELTDTLEKIPFVAQVNSLANAPVITSSLFGPQFSEMITSIPEDERALNVLKERVQQFPHIRNLFVGIDENSFLIYIHLKAAEPGVTPPAIVEEVEQMVQHYFPDYYMGGIPVINKELNETVAEESNFITVFSLLGVILLLFFFLRNWRYVVIAVFSVILPVIWLFGLFAILGLALNMITMIVPTLLLITGTATSVHILNICHKMGLTSASDTDAVLKSALNYTLLPVFFTAATTIAGFLSLSVSPIEAVRNTGILAAAGVALVFVFSLTLTVIGLKIFPQNEKKKTIHHFNRHNRDIANFFILTNRRFPYLPLILIPVIIAIAIMLLPQINVNTNPADYLNEDAVVLRDNLIIEKEVNGNLPVELILEKKEPFEPEDIRLMALYQEKLEQAGVVTNSFSLADILQYLNRAFYHRDELDLPANEAAFRRMIGIYQNLPDSVRNTVSRNELKEMRITGNTVFATSSEYENLLIRAEEIFEETFTRSDIEMLPQGYLPMYVTMNKYITFSQITSFLIAFLLIFILISICFRSVGLAIRSLLPNLFPIALVILVMIVFGITLDSGTAMISSLILGIAFDDSIHLINAYKHNRKRGLAKPEAAEEGLKTTANAMVSTSSALFVGFLIISFSGLGSLQHFGILCAIAVAGSLIGNLWLLPLLLKK